MALAAGTRLGPYEILEPLGAGGMGEVYRARDSRLKRDVALKVLPAELASEPERLGRFQREAETLAALNHPHIVTIFSVEEADVLHFLTMELVQGKTLTKVIPRDGLPLSRFFQIAIPLTEAVSAAHEKGIVHRDLKPGNVMVTEEDRVKVLDFGLAKLREGVRGEVDTESPTEPATGPGRVMGTAPYMSPEQVQGKPLDHRSDVFALGIMLYEMATGERPFAGDTFADVASSILKDDPVSVTEQKADLPRDLGKLIRHCLEKEPRRRFQSSLDLANELEDLRREVDSGEALTSGGAPVVTTRAGGKRRMWLAGGAVVAALALGVGSLILNRTAAPPAAPLEIRPFTGDGGTKMNPKLSPDGEKVAYAWAGSGDDNWDIYVKALGAGTKPLRLTEHPASDRFPTWSPDGRQIAFVRESDEGAAFYSVPWLGGHETRLADVTGPLTLTNFYPVPVASWSPDGEWLAYAETPSEGEPARIVRLSLDTLEKQPLSSPPPGTLGDLYPSFSPDGRRLAFVRSGSSTWGDLDVWVQPAEGGEARRLTSGEYEELDSLSWTPDGGEIIFAVGEGWGKTRIRRVGLAEGEPRPVPGIGEGAAMASVVGSRMVFAQRAPWPPDVWRVPGHKSSLPHHDAEKLISSSGADASAAYSPDGRKIAFSSTRTGVSNIWTCNSDGSDLVQLTSFEAHTGSPDWSPDGQRIAFDSMEAGDWNLYVIDAQGGRPRRLTKESSSDNIASWSRDGQWIYFTSNRGGDQQIWRIPVAGGQADQVTRGGGYRAMPSWDGKHLYYANRNTATGIWRVPLQGGAEAEVLPGPISAWAVSQSGLYYATSRGLAPGLGPGKSGRGQEYAIHHLDFESGHVMELFRKEGPFNQMGLAVSPDEEWVLYAEGTLQTTSELMLVENFR